MKKKRTIIFLCIILLLAAAFCLTAFRVRGSVSVKGEGSTQSPDPVFFSQKDPLWAGDLLGDSSFTMETSGCLTACLAAELRMQDISIPEINAMDPGTLNSFFSGKQVYDREGNIRPECIPGKDKRYFRNEENRFDSPFIGRDLSHCACPCERTGKFSLCPSCQMPGRTVLVHGSPPCRRGACSAVGLREPYLCHPLSVPPLTFSDP